ncbi:MAG TPA: carboxymuconolactone decarboxylase family protein [Chthoniobacteraceae bacterium]|nr:carboxymuconolactone decarboxylase family protein [Chthoniobacteraceae bacterium]
MSKRINYYEQNKHAVDMLSAVGKHINALDPKLKALVELRVSQINGCVYCVDLHSEQARAAGETQQRLDCLVAWDECPFFDDRERAAFAWAEALTHISATHAPDDVYNRVTAHFSEREVVDLTLAISVMNAWNRISISHRNLPKPRA